MALPASRRRLLVGAMSFLVIILLLRLAVLAASGRAPSRPFVVPATIDVNDARVPELMALEGIGRARAAAIVLHRVRHGPFRALAELDRVEGIGPETVARLRPSLRDPAEH